MIQRFTSRKFLLACAGFAVTVLVTAGVISPAQESEVLNSVVGGVSALSAVAFIVFEGLRDIKASSNGK